MNDTSRTWLVEEWAQKLGESIESMTMQRPEMKSGPAGLFDPALCWYQSAMGVAPGALLLIGAREEFWQEIGGVALKAAGLDDTTPDDARGTTVEILAQACSSLARVLTSRLGRDITAQTPCLAGPEVVETGKSRGANPVEVSLPGGGTGTIFVSSDALLEGALAPSNPEAMAANTARAAEPSDSPRQPVRSKTFDLLLEVELPVSVSFGRAQLPLRDVLKLSSGSIVELNRTITQPVEIIVNNCVIARGEVVVVEGNYGVRIQQVITREERLRTLN
ncbi:MAG: flagellar motor switch protein FliN [Bryobacteraceae bacterium]